MVMGDHEMGSAVIGDEADGRTRLLETAERLFAEHGVAETSVRAITGAARVNVSAVNYYFGSKEGLLRQIVERRLAPLNGECLRMLEEAQGSGAPTVEALLEALAGPSLRLAARHPHFARLASRLRIDADGSAWREYRALRRDLMARFRVSFGAALPWLDDAEIGERLHYVLGAIMHVWAHAPRGAAEAGTGLQRRFVTFYAAALRAPAPDDDRL